MTVSLVSRGTPITQAQRATATRVPTKLKVLVAISLPLTEPNGAFRSALEVSKLLKKRLMRRCNVLDHALVLVPHAG
jgi:hypothetical protein